MIEKHLTQKQIDELREIARNSAMLNSLLNLDRHQMMTFQEWVHLSITSLARQSLAFQKVAVDALQRAPAPVIILAREATDE